MRVVLSVGTVVLYLLHNDAWLWARSERVLGLPVGLLYHLIFCFLVVGWMALLVRYAWPLPTQSEVETDGGGPG